MTRTKHHTSHLVWCLPVGLALMSSETKEMETVNEMALILERATARGVRRGLDDKCDDVYNECPLSGEWAGESVEELLGDLICQGEGIYKQANGIGDDDPMYWSDVADMGTITDEICEAYLAGYNSVFSND